MLAADRDILAKPLAERISQTPRQIQEFIVRATPLVQISIKEADEEIRTNQPKIRTLFARIRARAPSNPIRCTMLEECYFQYNCELILQIKMN